MAPPAAPPTAWWSSLMSDPAEYLSFETPAHLSNWLAEHHATKRELWVRIYKKQSGTPSVTWEDCVVASLTWGWIDGLKKPLDEVSFLQRLTPRRSKSNWSKKNCDHAERLIAAGLMQASGLVHVEAAKQDGRWDKAYAGSANFVIPDDFLAALAANPQAKSAFDGLKRAHLFAIYYRLHSAARPQTRQKRMDDIIAKLARGEGVSQSAKGSI
ncbi:YdeI/OmpD-associated family protein [Asticcacaulis machinosus]|uniref:YdeI/OmpD-associated family protein n=1 Tax=Asticcacaulis machinosus TaxID=2984211 RepID=A0ABT5HIR4_9CAUL|nr:YdeI/OmpD-associated family protein [Asticcacaulis machinosus]MDC7675489.1 YdeI/OmpD-associated family protein [Asticcacaulis machinosus]